jgi:hypothetical protein
LAPRFGSLIEKCALLLHGRRSTIITSQIPVDKWHELIGDPTYADAILDRIVHNAQRINLTGHSLRRSQHSGPLSKNAPPAFLRARFVCPGRILPQPRAKPGLIARKPLARYSATRARSLAACCAYG